MSRSDADLRVRLGDNHQKNHHVLLHAFEELSILPDCLDDASGRPNAFSLTAHYGRQNHSGPRIRDTVTHLDFQGRARADNGRLDIGCILAFSMKSLSARIAAANSLLMAYAVPHGSGLGRVYPEPKDATRFPFQRDRDRIIHTQAFRRLKHKTQVFVSGHGDHYRTRITHTLEVAQLSRDIARTLGLNEDLAEAIALAHDLGHTPFGHAGEAAMNDCMRQYGGAFEHNHQSLRIVSVLEEKSMRYPGLNLSQEILDGLSKHRDHTKTSDHRALSLEAQVVNLADEVAYTAHDTDDGLRAGLFTRADIQRTTLGKMASFRAEEAQSELRGAIVDMLVSDLYEETERRLKLHAVRTLEDVYASRTDLVSFSPSMLKHTTELRKFLWDRLYSSPSVLRQAARGKRMITCLFQAYMKNPPAKVRSLQKKTGGALEEAVKDYIAGMTDTYASEKVSRLS